MSIAKEDISVRKISQKGKLPIDSDTLLEQAAAAFEELEAKKNAGNDHLIKMLSTSNPGLKIEKV